MNVLFVEFFPAGNANRGWASWKQLAERLIIYTPKPPLLIPPRLYANDPFTHKAVNLYLTKLIRDALCALAQQKPILFNFVFQFPEIVRKDVFAYMTYICVDEFPRMRKQTHRSNVLKLWYRGLLFQCYENHVARRVDRCFTPHYPLRDKLVIVNPKVDMLFHAVDYPPSSPPDGWQIRSSPINVAFAGYIHYRLLKDWLLEVLRQSDMVLHLIGPIHNYDVESLKLYPNLRLVASLDTNRLAMKLSQMDVLIMPYDPVLPEVRVLTTTSKLFQYIAALKPVVMSNLPHFLEMPEGVLYRADSPQEFVSQIRKAYAEDCQDYAKRRTTLALENTWDKRGEALLSVIRQDLDHELQNVGFRGEAEEN
jgi:hypothetical protein